MRHEDDLVNGRRARGPRDDRATPMEVVEADNLREVAVCRRTGRSPRTVVDTLLVAPVAVGERVYVHAGIAVARVETQA